MTPHEVLGVPETARPDVIRRAYLRLALRFHPDKSPGTAETFLAIHRAYILLTNPESLNDLPNAVPSYSTITKEDIDAFADSYRYSEEERLDVLNYYIRFKGDIVKVIQNVLCSNSKDTHRFMDIVRDPFRTRVSPPNSP